MLQSSIDAIAKRHTKEINIQKQQEQVNKFSIPSFSSHVITKIACAVAIVFLVGGVIYSKNNF